jgi:hypothetical protein
MRGLVPVLIACQLAAALILGSGLWVRSSTFIYLAVFLCYGTASPGRYKVILTPPLYFISDSPYKTYRAA